MTKRIFTKKAELLWHLVSTMEKERIIERAFCTKCKGSEMVDYSGSEKDGDLVLEGVCAKCGYRVVRVVEPAKRTRRSIDRLDTIEPAAASRPRSRAHRRAP